MTTPFWLYNPNILFKSSEISTFWPCVGMSFEEKLNAITRIVLLLTLIGYIATKKTKIILSGVVTLGAIVLLYLIKKEKVNRIEGFTQNDVYDALKIDFTEPTSTNPVMNVLLPEINENPTRNRAAPAFIPIVEANINQKTRQFVAENFNDPTIDERLFNDLGDNFTFDQSMRAWYPMPSTTIPNDQKTFAEYCYGDMIACRDDDNNEMACVRNMPPRWTNT
jgi:hypothetical protein